MESTSEVRPRPLYTRTVEKDKIVFKLTEEAKKMKKADHMEIAAIFPDILNEPRDLTTEELDAVNFVALDRVNKPCRILSRAKNQEMEVFGAYYCSEQKSRELGLEGPLWEIFEHVHRKDFQNMLKSAEHPEHKKRSPNKYEGAVSVIPGHQGVRGSRCATKYPAQMAPILAVIAKCRQKILEHACPEITDKESIYLEQWVHEAWLTFGHEDNKSATSCQFNYSGAFVDLKQALGNKGAFQTDGNDDCRCPTVMFMMENLPKEIYPGRFSIGGLGLTCSAKRFGTLVFSARYGHSGSAVARAAVEAIDEVVAELPADSADRTFLQGQKRELLDPQTHDEQRVNIITYCRQDAMRARPGEVDDNLLDAEKSLGTFGTMRNAMEWKMRFLYKRDAAVRDLDVDDLLEKFSWINEEGEQEQPARWIAQELCHPKRSREAREKEWADLHKAALFSDSGNRVPGQELTPGGKGREDVQRRKIEGTRKMRCRWGRGTEKRCKGQFYLDKGRERDTRCWRHPYDRYPLAEGEDDEPAGSERELLAADGGGMADSNIESDNSDADEDEDDDDEDDDGEDNDEEDNDEEDNDEEDNDEEDDVRVDIDRR